MGTVREDLQSLRESVGELEKGVQSLKESVGELEKEVQRPWNPFANETDENEVILAIGGVVYSIEWHLSQQYLNSERLSIGVLDDYLEEEEKDEIVQMMKETGWRSLSQRKTAPTFGQLISYMDSLKEYRFPPFYEIFMLIIFFSLF